MAANARPLTRADKKKLFVLLEEMQRRGLELPDEAKNILRTRSQKNIAFPVDNNGYFLRHDGHRYVPNQMQEAFIKSAARFVLLYSGRAGGKTAASSQKALLKVKEGKSGIILNPDFENLRYSTWAEFKQWIPWNTVVLSQRHRQNESWTPTRPFTLVFENGASIYLKGGRDADSVRGANVNWLWYDEAGRDRTGLGWRLGTATVRVGENPQAWCSTTPKGKSHWLYEFFIEQNLPVESLRLFREMGLDDKMIIETFQTSIEGNKDNLDPGFYASIIASYPSGWLQAQEVHGEFANEGGQIGNAGWFDERMLDDVPETVDTKYRYWDLAATEKKQAGNDPDETVGSLVDRFYIDEKFAGAHSLDADTEKKDPQYLIEDQVCGHWEWDKLKRVIANTARRDGELVPIYIEQEPASGGKNQVAALREYIHSFPELSAHIVEGIPATKVGDRVIAANMWFGLAARGKIWMKVAEWNKETLKQIDGFTLVAHDDRVTSITGGMFKFSAYRQWKRTPFMAV